MIYLQLFTKYGIRYKLLTNIPLFIKVWATALVPTVTVDSDDAERFIFINTEYQKLQ